MEQQEQVLRTLDMTTGGWVDFIHEAKERLLADNFKVLVTGEVGTGKSTLINALLRRKILPTSALVTTAIITEIKWGEEPGALLHFLNSEDDSALAPQEIAVDELAEYVTVIYEASKVDEILERRYEKVELFYPVELCRNGVEIIDSPGLGGGEVRAAITLRSLNAVDVVVYMLSATGPVTDSVQRWIKYFRAAGHQDIFFVVNRINEIPAVERETLKEHLARTLESAGLAAERVFLMNALGALEGHLSNDLAMLEESGLPQLEAALETFFIGQREQIKILRSANDLKESIRETRRAITEQKALLKEHLNSLEERHREMQEQLEERWRAEAVDLQARASNEDESQQIQDYTSQVLKDLREQVESTYLAEKQKSQAEVEQHSKKLASARKQLNKIDKELHTLISR
jgi:GTPase SAR1 family protein